MTRVSVIIPALEERASLNDLLNRIRSNAPIDEVIVVNDGSKEDFNWIVSRQVVSVIEHPYNKGNGAAIKSGVRAAKGDILVFMDADGQHDPDDIGTLLEHMDRYEMVVGARSSKQHASVGRRFVNGVYNRISSYVTGFRIKDLTSGFRAVRREVALDVLPLLPNGYSWPTTITLVLLRSGMSVKYVPIQAKPRQHGRSRIRPVRDGLRFFMIILKICTLYAPFRIFLPVSALMFLLGLINYAYTYFTAGRFTNMSALMFTTAVIIFMMGLISEQISQISLLRQQVGFRKKESPVQKDDPQPEDQNRR